MPTSTIEATRKLAAAGIAGAALSAISGVAVQLVVQPSTSVSDQMWSYPWSSGALVPVSIAYATLHVLVIAGLVGVRRSGMAGSTRAAAAGASTAIAGAEVAARRRGRLAPDPPRPHRRHGCHGRRRDLRARRRALGRRLPDPRPREPAQRQVARLAPLHAACDRAVDDRARRDQLHARSSGGRRRLLRVPTCAFFVALYTRPAPSALPARTAAQAQVA